MILYIVIYKCVQRRKYINGFSQWGSMHELFLKRMTGAGGRGGHCICQCTFPKSNQIISVHSGYLVLSHRSKATQKVLWYPFTSKHLLLLKKKKKSNRHKSHELLNNSSNHFLLYDVM